MINKIKNYKMLEDYLKYITKLFHCGYGLNEKK